MCLVVDPLCQPWDHCSTLVCVLVQINMNMCIYYISMYASVYILQSIRISICTRQYLEQNIIAIQYRCVTYIVKYMHSYLSMQNFEAEYICYILCVSYPKM